MARTPAPEFGAEAYFLFLAPDHASEPVYAFLVTKSGDHTFALLLEASPDEPAEEMRPALESLMRAILARLR